MRERYAVRVYKQYFNFAASHFLIFADGSRERLHGHNYQVTVRLDGDCSAGDLVVDFIPLKPIVKGICDELDHRTLLPRDNPLLHLKQGEGLLWAHHDDGSRFAFPPGDVRILPLPNTSTEMLARFVAHELAERLHATIPEARIDALEIQVEESPGQAGLCRLELS